MTSLEHEMVLRRVIEAVAHETLFDAGEVGGYSRVQPVARARMLAWWLTKEITGLTYSALARVADRDRTTLMHGCQKIDGLLHTDAALQRQLRRIVVRLYEQQRARMNPAEVAAE